MTLHIPTYIRKLFPRKKSKVHPLIIDTICINTIIMNESDSSRTLVRKCRRDSDCDTIE